MTNEGPQVSREQDLIAQEGLANEAAGEAYFLGERQTAEVNGGYVPKRGIRIRAFLEGRDTSPASCALAFLVDVGAGCAAGGMAHLMKAPTWAAVLILVATTAAAGWLTFKAAFQQRK